MKSSLLKFSKRLEENKYFRATRQGFTLMMPLLLIGSFCLVIMNFPFEPFQQLLKGSGSFFYEILSFIYHGCFDFFSLILVVLISISYAMENSDDIFNIILTPMLSVAVFMTLFNLGQGALTSNFGVQGSFTALLVALLVSGFYLKLYHRRIFKKITASELDIRFADAIRAIIPAIIILLVTAILNYIILTVFDVHNIFELISYFANELFMKLGNHYTTPILYTLLVHIFWFFGIHGGNALEMVAQNSIAEIVPGQIFNKTFFDVFVAMGGCGAAICLLIALLIVSRHKHSKNLGRFSAFPVLFNINEILTFGLPVIWNPILFIPFLLVPLEILGISSFAVATGLVPYVSEATSWVTPVFVSGYMATGSFRACLLQLICIGVGVATYLPFLRLNEQIQELQFKERVEELVAYLKQAEEETKEVDFLSTTGQIGVTARLLMQDLKDAIEKKQLYLLYQPQVNSRGRCFGAEALIRWEHPLAGFIYPPLIIALAKNGRLLPKLETQLFDMACRAISEVSGQFGGEFKISVNITARSLYWEQLEQCVADSIERYGIEPESLWIEITEQDVLANQKIVLDKLSALKNSGHKLLIDDFGMGRTSLLYLQMNQFDMVKLDASLTQTVLTQQTNCEIISSVVELGRKLNVAVIAECVETAEQEERLVELGCDWFQGYLFSRPLTLENFIQFLKENEG